MSRMNEIIEAKDREISGLAYQRTLYRDEVERLRTEMAGLRADVQALREIADHLDRDPTDGRRWWRNVPMYASMSDRAHKLYEEMQ